jgi:hypothetical protein
MTGAPTRARLLAASLLGIAWLAVAGPAAAGARPRHVRTLARQVAAAPVKASAPGAGPSVQYVTDKRAYLNRGARDGLQAKQQVQLYRSGRAVATCTVDSVADHQATCVGGRPRPGDTFRLSSRGGGKRREPAPAELPPLTDEATLATRAAAVADAPYEKVDFSGARTLADHTRAIVSPAFTLWRTEPDPRGDYTLLEIDAALQVYDLAATGIDFEAAFTAMQWGARAAIGRFRPGTESQFYLWEAELAKRRTAGNTVFAVGRIWPWHTPGLTMLDGLQVGRKNDEGTAEGGVYAGFVPWSTSTAPSLAARAAGAYGTLVETGGRTGFRLAREEARLGVAAAPGTGLVTDGELLGQAWLGAWNVGVGGRGLMASVVSPHPVLERATFDLGARPGERFALGLHARYFGPPLPGAVVLVGVTPAAAGSENLVADLHWTLASWLGVAGFGGFNRDRDTGQGVAYGSAALSLPRFFGGAGGVSVGGEIEEGWMSGRLAYAEIVARLADRFALVARGSVSTTAFEVPSPLLNVDEIGGNIHLDGPLASWLRLRLWALIRVPFLIQGAFPTGASYGVVAGTSLTASY